MLSLIGEKASRTTYAAMIVMVLSDACSTQTPADPDELFRSLAADLGVRRREDEVRLISRRLKCSQSPSKCKGSTLFTTTTSEVTTRQVNYQRFPSDHADTNISLHPSQSFLRSRYHYLFSPSSNTSGPRTPLPLASHYHP